MLPLKGLYTDCRPVAQPKDTYRNARNILMTELYGSILNEPGFDETAIGYPSTLARPIGVTVFPDNSYVVYSDGIDGGLDRIGIVDINGDYTDLIVDDVLNFSYLHAIRSSEVDYSFLNQRIVAWTDDFNKPRILNIDDLPFDLNIDLSLVDPDNISDIEIFPSFKLPKINLVSVDSAGSLKAGNITFSVAYENNDGTRTSNSIPQCSVNIIDDSYGDSISNIDGAIPGTLTNKAVHLTIDNVDTRYDRLVLLAIYKINGQTQAFEVKKVDINNTSINISYIGTENVIPITLEELLRVNPVYIRSKALAQLNNVLYHGNLTADDEIDYQESANNIRILYNTKLVALSDINNSYKNNLSPGFTHGGVYAFYIRFILKNGSTSRAFHIPGRPIISGTETDASTLATGAGFTSVKKYQVEDTTNASGTTYSLVGDTYKADTTAQSNMGYWENQDEIYPNDFPDLEGEKVRHHVFPSIRTCQSIHYSGESAYGVNKIDILGIDVVNVDIPSDILEKIEGWEIVYAKRDYTNTNVFGTDMLLYPANSEDLPLVVWSSGGNFGNDYRTDSGANPNRFVGFNKFYLRSHIFELLKDKPQLGLENLYVDYEYKLQKLFAYNGNIAQSGTDVGENPGATLDYTTNAETNATFLGLQIITKIDAYRYLPTGIMDGNIRSIKNEESILLNLHQDDVSSYLDLTATIETGSQSRGPIFPFTITVGQDREESFLFTLKQIKSNLFVNFDQQILQTTDKVFCKELDDMDHGDTIRGGDCFIGTRTFLTTAGLSGDDVNGVQDVVNSGVTIVRAHIAESRYNLDLIYEIQGDIASKHYPKTHGNFFWNNPEPALQYAFGQDGMIFSLKDGNINKPGVSVDYNAINDYYQSIIFSPSQVFTSQFPFRVIRSGFAGTNQQSIRSWKTYLIADKYEANRNKGEIENIAVFDDVLLIHHKHALFRTIGKERILTNTTEVYLGTGDIFGQQPKDVIPEKLGYLGTQNIFSCISFKGAYCWQNQQEGTVYLMTSNGVDEISDNGMKIFFFENLMINNTLPNQPFNTGALIAGFDKPANRVLFTKQGDDPFTLSYSLDYKCWVCFHDYIPDYYYYNNNNLFTIKDSKLYKTDSSTKKAIYFGSTIYPSYIDAVFNEYVKEDKLFYGAKWMAEVYDSNAVLLRNKTLTSIQAWTDYQNTTEIALVPFSTYGVAHNTRKVLSQDWSFNYLKDNNSDPFKRRPLLDKYALIRFKYDNAANLDLSQNSLYLYSIDAIFRKG